MFFLFFGNLGKIGVLAACPLPPRESAPSPRSALWLILPSLNVHTQEMFHWCYRTWQPQTKDAREGSDRQMYRRHCVRCTRRCHRNNRLELRWRRLLWGICFDADNTNVLSNAMIPIICESAIYPFHNVSNKISLYFNDSFWKSEEIDWHSLRSTLIKGC